MFKNLFIADLKMLVRNRQAIFWAFMFPLIFSLIFGLFFGKNAKAGTIAVINRSNSEISKQYEQALKDSEIFTVVERSSLADAKDEIKKNKLMAAVEIPEGFGEIPAQLAVYPPIAVNTQYLTVLVDPGNSQANAALTGFTDKFFATTNLKLQRAQEFFSYKIEKTNEKVLNYYDFILAGILGLAIMNSSIIGISVAMSKYREDKILKRITTTPLKTSTFILSQVLTRILLNLTQIAAVLAIGAYVFDAHIYGNVFIIVAVAMVGAILFQLMGFAVAAFSKTTDAAQGLATFVTIPMMFLAGVFFPVDALPEWLAKIVQYLPLAPLLRILRTVALEGESPFFDVKNVIIVVLWIIAMLLVSIWKFKLTEE